MPRPPVPARAPRLPPDALGAGPVDAAGPPQGSGGDAGAVLVIDDPRFDRHASAGYHPERPERLAAARAALARTRARTRAVAARAASDDELARVHAPAYVEWLAKQDGASYVDPDTYLAPGSPEAARLAAGGACALVDALLAGEARRGIALVRPPGHHARRDQAMGFCLLNNVAVAAAHARARGLARVAIVDWDVHHGNGTQDIFWRDPSVLYASLHQFPFYPGTGALDERGEADGTGATLNVPLSAGADDAVYRSAFERVVVPALEEFRPDLVLVSAGYDASARDPLAEMHLEPRAFGWMTRALTAVAERSAAGRIALVLEGGYDLVALEAGLVASLDALGGLAGEELPEAAGHGDVERAARSAARSFASLASIA